MCLYIRMQMKRFVHWKGMKEMGKKKRKAEREREIERERERDK